MKNLERPRIQEPSNEALPSVPEYFPAITPPNVVLKVAANAREFEVGKPATLPLFVIPKGYKLSPEIQLNGLLGTLPGQGRVLNTMDPRVSIKGGGRVKNGEPAMWEKSTTWRDVTRVMGLYTLKEAEKDWAVAESYAETSFAQPHAIVELLAIPYPDTDGIMVLRPVAELQEVGILPKYYANGTEHVRFVDYFRESFSNVRLGDFIAFVNSKQFDKAHGAIESANAELKKAGHDVSISTLLLLTTSRIARTLGAIHHRGEMHYATHGDNFSIAGDVFDGATVKPAFPLTREDAERTYEDEIGRGETILHPYFSEAIGSGWESDKASRFGALQQIYHFADALRSVYTNEKLPSDETIQEQFRKLYLAVCPENSSILSSPILVQKEVEHDA